MPPHSSCAGCGPGHTLSQHGESFVHKLHPWSHEEKLGLFLLEAVHGEAWLWCS